MTERKSLLHCARVYLAQSRHFTSRRRGWSFVLLKCMAMWLAFRQKTYDLIGERE